MEYLLFGFMRHSRDLRRFENSLGYEKSIDALCSFCSSLKTCTRSQSIFRLVTVISLVTNHCCTGDQSILDLLNTKQTKQAFDH